MMVAAACARVIVKRYYPACRVPISSGVSAFSTAALVLFFISSFVRPLLMVKKNDPKQIKGASFL